MKKLCLFILIIVLFPCISTYAAPYTMIVPLTSTNTTIEDLGNGYYAITSIEYDNSGVSLLSTTKTKSGSKSYTIKDSNGNACASFIIYATFTYSANSVVCTSKSYSTNIYDNHWHFNSASVAASGNSAYGYCNCICKVYGITTQNISKTITLTCDTNGNLS